MKARITFILAPKSDTQGEVWVNLVLEDNNIQKVPLGISTPFSQWDPMQERILGNDEQTKEHNIRLDLLKGYLEAVYNKTQLKQETIGNNWLSDHVSLCFKYAKKHLKDYSFFRFKSILSLPRFVELNVQVRLDYPRIPSEI
jgi:hypothetical protein